MKKPQSGALLQRVPTLIKKPNKAFVMRVERIRFSQIKEKP